MKRGKLWQWAWCLVLCFVLLTLPILGCAKTLPTAPSLPTEPTPVEQNPVVEYASERSLPQPIIDKLQPLGYDGMNLNEKALMDYLYGISQAEVVSPEVLEFVPSSYREEVTQSLQIKVVDAVSSDGEVSHEEADGLIYLSHFSGKTQRELIEFGLDDTSIEFLILNSSLENRDFARYAVENKLCIQDHKLTDLETSFLEKPEEYAQVLLSDYLSQLSQTYPAVTEELGKLPDLKPDTSNSEAVTQESEKVYLLTGSSIYESLRPWIDRWIEDVEKTGTKVLTKTITKETPNEIRALLQNTPNLTGCLLLGDIPTVKYEMDFELEGKPFHEEFPTDLYYMDLDGDWLDADNDGILDTHDGNISPEIWVGRLKASNLPALGNEIDLLRNYFDKNRLYRIGALTLPYRALLYIDDMSDVLWTDSSGKPVTYPDLAPVYDKALSPTYDQRVVAESEATTAADYLKRLDDGWNLVRLVVHSGGIGHHFRAGNKWNGKVFPEDICRKDPKAFFYAIISCENFDYTRPNYMGGCYVFSESYSLLAIGESGIHDVLQVLPEEFFPRLTTESFGSAFLHYLQECVKRKARIDSVRNAIMIGDPLLKPVYNGQDSDSDGLADRYELTVGLSPYDIDTDHDGSSDLEEAKSIEFLRHKKVHSIEATEDILELTSSTNPEVKEAFDLMIKGGNPYREIQKAKEATANIKIDGMRDDWQGIEPVCIDPEGDNKGDVPGTDIRAVYAVTDDNYLYLMWDVIGGPNLVEDPSYCFEVDIDMDGDPEYQPGFRTSGYTWLYDLRESNERKEPPLQLRDTEAAAEEIIEFKIPLNYIGNSVRLEVRPYIWSISIKLTTDLASAGQVGSDYGYEIPRYNTELQVLYWLAEQNEFIKDDTLAQAIAMANGLWVTMGDDEVRQAVHRDANYLLNFFRETNEMQKTRGYYQLENYPLEAKVCLGWTGNQTPVLSQEHALFLFLDDKLNLNAYEWNNISIETLREMREYMDKMGWVNESVDETVANLEEYFSFSNHWKYTGPKSSESRILIEQMEVSSWFIGNMDFEYKYYLENDVGIGVCTDEEAFVDAWCKSWGVATTALQMMKKGQTHTAVIYCEPTNAKWKVDKKQVEIFSTFDPEINRDYLIFKPPIMQKGYTGNSNIIRDYLPKGWVYLPSSAYVMIRKNIPGEEIEKLLLDGVPSERMKQWLFYTIP